MGHGWWSPPNASDDRALHDREMNTTIHNEMEIEQVKRMVGEGVVRAK